jgi:hypothetical protein
MALIPSVLTPRLPTDFTDYPELAGRGATARLIVLSGLPGVRKSTLAEEAGRALGVPVFAVDWLLGPGWKAASAAYPAGTTAETGPTSNDGWRSSCRGPARCSPSTPSSCYR